MVSISQLHQPKSVVARRDQRMLDAALNELGFHGRALTPEAIAMRTGLPPDVARAFLDSKGIAQALLQPIPAMQRFMAARAARTDIDAAIADVKKALPKAYKAPPAPPAELLGYSRPPQLHRLHDAHGMGLDGQLIAGHGLGVLLGGVAAAVSAAAGFSGDQALGVGVLAYAAGLTFPVIASPLNVLRKQKKIDVANARIAQDEAKEIEAYTAQRAATADARKQQQEAKDAWLAGIAADKAARANTVGEAHLEPIGRVLEALQPEVQAYVARYVRPLAEELLKKHDFELTPDAAARLNYWHELGYVPHERSRESWAKELPIRRGFVISDFNPADGAHRASLENDLKSLPDSARIAIAEAYRNAFFQGNACRARGDKSAQARTLDVLERYSVAVRQRC
jgi:hypothetical protein